MSAVARPVLGREKQTSETSELWNRFLGHYFPFLRAWVRRRWAGRDEHLLDECLDDALLELWAHSDAWDPLRGTLLAHISNKARGLLANRLRSFRRRHEREQCVGVFEQDFLKKHGVKLRSPDCLPIEGGEDEARLQKCLRGLSSQELAEIAMLVRRAATAEWVRFLGLEDVPEPDQSWRVYREKDRLRRKLRRQWKKRCTSAP